LLPVAREITGSPIIFSIPITSFVIKFTSLFVRVLQISFSRFGQPQTANECVSKQSTFPNSKYIFCKSRATVRAVPAPTNFKFQISNRALQIARFKYHKFSFSVSRTSAILFAL
jgi:hypothetical protein